MREPVLPLVVLTRALFLGLALASEVRGRPALPADAFIAVGLAAMPLDHPTRTRILGYLRILPGDHFRSIARNLGLSVGEARHHLDILIRNGLILEKKETLRTRYYTRGQPADADRNELFSQQWAYRDLRMRILMKVRSHGNVSAKEVAVALGISRQLAAYHLARLVELGFVHHEGRHYRPTAIPPAKGKVPQANRA